MLPSLKYFPCLFRRFLWPLGTRSFAHWRFLLLNVLRWLINSRALGYFRAFAFSLPNPSMVLGLKDKHRAVICRINHFIYRHPPWWLVFGLQDVVLNNYLAVCRAALYAVCFYTLSKCFQLFIIVILLSFDNWNNVDRHRDRPCMSCQVVHQILLFFLTKLKPFETLIDALRQVTI